MDYWLEWGNTELGKSVVRTFRFMHLISLNRLDREIKTYLELSQKEIAKNKFYVKSTKKGSYENNAR